jgi:hypothetical protein
MSGQKPVRYDKRVSYRPCLYQELSRGSLLIPSILAVSERMQAYPMIVFSANYLWEATIKPTLTNFTSATTPLSIMLEKGPYSLSATPCILYIFVCLHAYVLFMPETIIDKMYQRSTYT